jgi:hypothetical protein
MTKFRQMSVSRSDQASGTFLYNRFVASDLECDPDGLDGWQGSCENRWATRLRLCAGGNENL